MHNTLLRFIKTDTMHAKISIPFKKQYQAVSFSRKTRDFPAPSKMGLASKICCSIHEC